MKTITLITCYIVFAICINANAQTPSAPEICMVSVDTGSINNLIYWNKTLYLNVDSFIVYREVNTSLHIYKQIGAVSNDSLSMFTDTARSIGPNTGDPNLGSSCYKLQIRNNSGNYSALSPFHRTIFISDAGQGEFIVNNAYSVEGMPTPVVNYMLLCDTLSNDNWSVVDLISNTAASAIDPDFTSHSISARWRIKTGWGISCDPTRIISTSRSNIKRPSLSIGILPIRKIDFEVYIYPNPAKDNFTIEFSLLTGKAQLKIINVLGQAVYNESIIASSSEKKIKEINTTNFTKGIYSIVIETSQSKMIKKLVIN